GPAPRRIAVEIELAAVDVRHLGQALAERIEADHVGIHLTKAHGHGIDAQLQLLFEVGDLPFLLRQQLSEMDRIAQPHALVVTASDLQPEREGTTEKSQRQADENGQREGVRKVQLPCTAFATGKENNVHAPCTN